MTSNDDARLDGALAPRDALLLLPGLGAALAAARGHSTVALVLLGVLAAGIVARLVLGARVHLAIARVVRRLEVVLTWLAVAFLWCAIVVPGWLVHHVRSRGGRRSTGEAEGWVASAPVARTSRAFAAPTAAERTSGSTVLQVIGLVAVLLLVDLGTGIAWQWATRSEVGDRIGIGRDGTYEDPRAGSPAFDGSPWAGQQLRELQRLPQAYWPYTGNRSLDYRSDTVNVDGWIRRSYEPSGVGDDVPVVAFFGGSTMFGEGQRDEHTIASEIARLAEEAGTPIRVVNYGQRSWTAWQEVVLYDQMASDRNDPNHPDLVVFYDGGNEVMQQQQASTAGWPTIYNVDGIARDLTGRAAGSTRAAEVGGRSLASEVSSWYSSRSTLFRVGRALRSAVGAAPEATPPPRRSDQVQVGRDAAAVYLRAVDIARTTSAREGIEPTFYWQPIQQAQGLQAHETATALVEAAGGIEVIDDALDGHQPVFYDEIHTNEEGARVVAARIWETLGPKVADAS